jgi:hypothetical protein
VAVWTGLCLFRKGTVAGSFECGNEHGAFMKGKELVGRTYCRLHKSRDQTKRAGHVYQSCLWFYQIQNPHFGNSSELTVAAVNQLFQIAHLILKTVRQKFIARLYRS